jgi:hypothetical protein
MQYLQRMCFLVVYSFHLEFASQYTRHISRSAVPREQYIINVANMDRFIDESHNIHVFIVSL